MSSHPVFTDPKKLRRDDILFCLAEVPASSEIVVGSSDGKLHVFDSQAEELEGVAIESSSGEGHTSYITGVAQVPGAFVTGSYDRHLIWWDAAKRSAIRKIQAHQKWIRDVVASPDGRTIASVADDMVCRLWDASSGELRAELTGHATITPTEYPSMLFTCAFSPDGKLLATADKLGSVIVWDAHTGAQIAKMEDPLMYTWDPDRRRHSIGGIRALIFTPDGQTLVAGGIGQIGNIDHLGSQARVTAFDWQKGEKLAEIESAEEKGIIEKFAFTPDGQWLVAAGGANKGLRLVLDPRNWKIQAESGFDFHIHDFAFGQDTEGAPTLCSVGHNEIRVEKVSGA